MMNLHSLATSAINALNPALPATLYRSTGQSTVSTGPDAGKILPTYAKGVDVRIRMLSESAEELHHAERVGTEEVTRKCYLFSKPNLESRVAGIVRPLSRNGDMFQLDNGTWWLVTAVIEDFSRSGWVCARAVLQVKAPEIKE